MTLDLSRNQLYGNIPWSLVNCKDLEVLDLSHNQLSDTFPFWLQNLQRLQVLVLGSNKFHGPICCAHDFVGFMTLKIIDLSHNDFIGNLPSEYFRNWTSMSAKVSQKPNESQDSTYSGKMYYNDSVSLIIKGQEMELVKTLTIFMSVDLSNNKFDGGIPTTLWRLRSLIMLNLSSNNFNGLIPSAIGNLKELESLDLSNNKLFGKIPQQLTALTFLAYLNLSTINLWVKYHKVDKFQHFKILLLRVTWDCAAFHCPENVKLLPCQLLMMTTIMRNQIPYLVLDGKQ
nr:receptor-like protein 32 [Ziziphus jujuba var. spinosa]